MKDRKRWGRRWELDESQCFFFLLQKRDFEGLKEMSYGGNHVINRTMLSFYAPFDDADVKIFQVFK